MTQKRPSRDYRIEFAPVSLPTEFPLKHFRQRDHSDAPIRRLHLHDFLEVGFCHSGSGVFVIGERVWPFQSGDLTVISENEPHYARSANGTTSDWTWFYLDPSRLLGRLDPSARWLPVSALAGKVLKNVLDSKGTDRIVNLLPVILAELEDKKPGWQDATRGLLIALFCEVHRQSSRKRGAIPAAGLSRMGPALDFIATHFSKEISQERLASLSGMSQTHFRRLFRSTFGKSPHRYLTELRVHAAAAALRDERKRISEAAFDAGFCTLSTFNRAFQSVLGESPRDWRKQNV